MSEFPKRKLLKLDKTSVEGRGTSGECRGSSDTETRNLKPDTMYHFQVSGVRLRSVEGQAGGEKSSVNSTSGRNSTKIFI
jgi:hypothetical protein